MPRLTWTLLPLFMGLAACGFHLRGAAPLADDLKSMALDCPQLQERLFCQALERYLEANGINPRAQDSRYDLRILGVNSGRRAVSVNQRGVATEIELTLSATFDLISDDGIPMLAPTLVSASESYQNDENQVLGKKREEQQLTRDLSQQLARQIVSRLTPLTRERIAAIRAAARDDAPAPAGEQPSQPTPEH